MSSYSILINKDKESWLVVETDNVIRVFTNKISAVQYRESNKEKVISVLHRYSDGTLQPLLNWPGEAATSVNVKPSSEMLDEVYGDLDKLNDYEENIDFYELCAANEELNELEEPIQEE